MNVLDLFSGIGGFSLGLERAGMRTVAFCEIEPYQRAVLAKHWPGVPCYEDITALTADRLRADGIEVDVICGGFPCQDISQAGAGAGIDGARSGLWKHYARLIDELRPKFVIVENVSALLRRGLDRVLGDLAAVGYDAEWHCIPAAAVGAPHIRDRLWLIAYPQHSDTDSQRPHRAQIDQQGSSEFRHEQVGQLGQICEDVAHPDFNPGDERRPGDGEEGAGGRYADRGGVSAHHVADTHSIDRRQGAAWEDRAQASDPGGWRTEPNVGRVANGIPSRVDRLKCLGNAVVPAIPQIIGEAIMAVHRQS